MKNFLRYILFAGTLLLFCLPLHAQLLVTDLQTISIDFNGCDGTGFQPGGREGKFDSDMWMVLGVDSESMTFGDTRTSGDYARGLKITEEAKASTGGVYAFKKNENIALGWQATEGDLTPGNLVLWLQNSTGNTIDGFEIAFTRWVRNDQSRSSHLNFGFSLMLPETGEETGEVLDWYSSPIASDESGFQLLPSGGISISQPLLNGQDMFLIWSTSDNGGSSSRDELGISDIRITPIATPLPSTFFLFGIPCIMAIFARRQKNNE